MHREYLDNHTQEETGDFSFEAYVEEISMAKVKRRYIVNGVPIWVTGTSEQEVADKYADLKYSQENGRTLGRKKHNFELFTERNWQYISQTVSTDTEKDYRTYLEKDLLPFFGKTNVEDIDWRTIQAFYDKFKAHSFSTVHKRKVILSRILQIAVGDGLIPNDPTKDKRLTHSKRKTERPVPNVRAFREFLKQITLLNASNERLYMALASYTGLRRGEILALRWEDISFENAVISVKHAVNTRQTSKEAPGVIKEPKTASGKRIVPMVVPLMNILLTERHQHEFIIVDSEGSPMHTEAQYNTMWRSIRKQIDLGQYTSHSFRHAMCTVLIAGGVDIKTVQAILGHAQASTTLDIYAHALSDQVSEAGMIFIDKLTG